MNENAMEAAARTCTHLLGVARGLVADLGDADAAAPAAPTGKTPGWLLGHLSVSGDFVRRKFGAAPLTPKDWGPKFGPGTQPSHSPPDYPPMTELRAVFDGVYADLALIAPAISVDALSGPSPFANVSVAPELALARDAFPTLGAFASWIMTGHFAYHLGQLSGWKEARRAG